MSTRSSIAYAHDAHIYEETSEPVHSFGKFKGWNVHLGIDAVAVDSFRVDNDNVQVSLKEISGIAKELSVVSLRLPLVDIKEIEWDCDGLGIVVIGGSLTAWLFTNKMYGLLTVSSDNEARFKTWLHTSSKL